MSFTKGHALVVGVGTFKNHSNLDVPVTVADAQAVYDVLIDEKYCGYSKSKVAFLKEEEATRSKIKKELRELAKVAKPTDTVFIFLCSHGVPGEDGQWYFTTHDTVMKGSKAQKGTGGLNEEELIRAFRKIDAARIFIVFNACFSGSISPGSLSADEADDDIPSLAPTSRTKNALLGTGKGRIILTASGEKEKSYFSEGEKTTIFTKAMVDGLKGKGTRGKKGFISAFNLYEHLHEEVQSTVKSMYKRPQNPELTVLKGIGSFAVSLYKGGGSLSVDDDDLDDALPRSADAVSEAEAQDAINQVINMVTNNQSGGINIGGQNVSVSGNVVGGDSIGGNQTNVSGGSFSFGNINTGGGAFMAGNKIDNRGGNFSVQGNIGADSEANPLDALKDTVRAIRSQLDDLDIDEDMYEAIDDDLNSALKQLRKDEPKLSIVRRKVESAAELLSENGVDELSQQLSNSLTLL